MTAGPPAGQSTVASARSEPWAHPARDVSRELGSDPETGLSSDEALRRLALDGPNALADATTKSTAQRFAEQFTDPLVVLLLAAIGISLLAWWSDGADGAPIESVVIAVIVVANAVIGTWQEGRAINAVAALRRMSGVQTRVLRDGREESVPAVELVVGDVVLLAEGDAVAADARVLSTFGLEVSEASLTGESVPVEKSSPPAAAQALVADRSSMVHSGTAVTKGHGSCVVTAIGEATEVGRIAELLRSADVERTPLQRQIDQLSVRLGYLVVILAIATVGAIVLTSDVDTLAEALDALMVAVSLAVAAVPEGLPAILTVVLALGVQRMAGHRAIVKRLLSVETLGAASVICTDKTGTLTRNEMTVVGLSTATGEATLSGVGYSTDGEVIPVVPAGGGSGCHAADVRALLEAGALANNARLGAADSGPTGDPTELALVVAAHKAPAPSDDRADQEAPNLERVAELPFDSDRKLMSTLHRSTGTSTLLQITKGAPDVVLQRCTLQLAEGSEQILDERARVQVLATIDRFADEGLRTLAVARRHHSTPPEPFDVCCEEKLTLLGVVGIADPAKEEVIPVIAEAARAGIRTVMVTGDHPRTARAIGASLGLECGPESVLTGADVTAGALDSDDAVGRTAVFARVSPEDKLRIVRAYQDAGQIVAMTGDGVNDAPALRQADIGVAMGQAGTEVARDAADMILADDDYRTIVRAVREGRELFADIRKFLRYLLASNAGEVLVMILGVLGASLIGLEAVDGELAVPLLATQILWINLLTDSALALALGVDPSVDDVMQEPPRHLDEPIVNRQMWVTIALVGVVSAVAGLIALDLELAGGLLGGSGDLTSARTMLFTTIVLAQVFNAFNARSDRVSAFRSPFSNRLLWIAVIVTVFAQVLVVHLPGLNSAFETTPLDIGQWAICLGLASLVLVADEVRKLVVPVLDRRRASVRLISV